MSVNTVERQPTEWEKIFVSDTSDKGLMISIHRGLLKLNNRNHNPNENWAEVLNRHFSKEVQMISKLMKQSSKSLFIREMQIKTVVRYFLMPIKRFLQTKQTNKTPRITSIGKDVKLEPWYTGGRNVKWYGLYGKQYVGSL